MDATALVSLVCPECMLWKVSTALTCSSPATGTEPDCLAALSSDDGSSDGGTVLMCEEDDVRSSYSCDVLS